MTISSSTLTQKAAGYMLAAANASKRESNIQNNKSSKSNNTKTKSKSSK
jgi:hypothetical protein